MSETKQSGRVLRRIGAVLAGLLVVVILDLGIDVLLHATGIYPPWFQPMRTSLWLIAIGYRTVDGIADIEGNYPSKGVGERGAWFRDSEGNLLGVGQPVR